MSLLNLTTQYEKKRIITYHNKGVKAIYRNKEMQHIIGNIYKDKETDDGFGQFKCNIYCYFDDFNIGIDMGAIYNLSERDSENLYMIIKENGMSSAGDFVRMMEQRVLKCFHIGNTQIELAKHIKPDRVDVYKEARLAFRMLKDREYAEERKKREEEDRTYCAEQNEKAEQTINNAIKIMRTGGELKNIEVIIYKDKYDYREYSVINIIATRFNVNIPIRVRGWINSSLTKIEIIDGKVNKIWYDGNKSKTILTYLNRLITEVDNKQIKAA